MVNILIEQLYYSEARLAIAPAWNIFSSGGGELETMNSSQYLNTYSIFMFQKQVHPIYTKLEFI
jgi:hypothetical protein